MRRSRKPFRAFGSDEGSNPSPSASGLWGTGGGGWGGGNRGGGRGRKIGGEELRQAAEEWLLAAEAGIIRTRSGDPYKPSAIRSYKQALHAKVLPELGNSKLTAITTNALQDLADQLVSEGLSPSTIRNTLLPLRALYRRALARGDVAINPTLKLSLPAVRGRRERVARPDEAAALISAVPLSDRAIWATAVYAGLRLGELQALDWNQINLDENLINVERSWDRIAGFIEPKSRSGKRRVPITNTLRSHLINHRLQQGTGGQGLLYPNHNGDRPFNPSTITLRARTAWKKQQPHPDNPARMPTHLRRLHDRRRRQRQSTQHLHGPRKHHHHPRPLRPPPPRQRTPSRPTPRHLAHQQHQKAAAVS